jgi:hypothetical protein
LSRQELEKQQSELKEMLDKLEADRNMELSERLKLEEEIAAKQVNNNQNQGLTKVLLIFP